MRGQVRATHAICDRPRTACPRIAILLSFAASCEPKDERTIWKGNSVVTREFLGTTLTAAGVGACLNALFPALGDSDVSPREAGGLSFWEADFACGFGILCIISPSKMSLGL